MRRALVPGTFDPITNGHIDVIARASQMFDEVIVGVAKSDKKRPLFTLEERVALANEATAHLDNVSVVGFDDLLVHFAEEIDCKFVVKGLRAITDFEYEFQMTAAQYMYLSSSIVREIASFHGNISELVTPGVEKALRARFSC